jgi:hypothetical protein
MTYRISTKDANLLQNVAAHLSDTFADTALEQLLEARAGVNETIAMLADALDAIVHSLVHSLSEFDDEGLIEHTQQMMAARAALARVKA